MADLDTLAAQLSQLTVREAIQLVKKLIGDAGPSGHAHPFGLVSVILQSCGYNKISVIKAVREVTNLGLKEAKDLVESAPKVVRAELQPAEAETIVRKLIEAGATAHVQG
jgi:large subunit ribosomal protein L7/L12